MLLLLQVMAARSIGPSLGHLLGSACLKYYVDTNQVPSGLTNSSPNWIGAWWIGFLVIGNLSLGNR